MNRSADRLNLCLPELKGAGQLKNFLLCEPRNDFEFQLERCTRSFHSALRVGVNSDGKDKQFATEYLSEFVVDIFQRE